MADSLAASMKETIGSESKIMTTAKSKLQALKEGAEAKANAIKSYIGRGLGAIARPFGPLVRYIRRMIATALTAAAIMFRVATVAAGAASEAVAPK